MAIVGSSGSGKTTLTRLLDRSYDGYRGSIQIDGVELSGCSIPSLRRNVVSVEPATCSALHSALNNDAPIDVEISGVAANALGAKRIGQICFDLAKETRMQTILVEDEAIVEAQKLIWKAHRQLVEPAGATALAALTSGAYKPEQSEKVAVLLCGANIAPDPFQ